LAKSGPFLLEIVGISADFLPKFAGDGTGGEFGRNHALLQTESR
jgi:hypothetical protein